MVSGSKNASHPGSDQPIPPISSDSAGSIMTAGCGLKKTMTVRDALPGFGTR